MRVNELRYRTNRNLGNMEHEHVELVVELDPDEQPGVALLRARAFCRRAFNLAPLTPEEEARMQALLFGSEPDGGSHE